MSPLDYRILALARNDEANTGKLVIINILDLDLFHVKYARNGHTLVGGLWREV